MILDPKKKAAILKAPRYRPGEFRPLETSLQMQAVIARLKTPRQITPLSSPVSMSSDVGRVNARMSEPGIRRKV